MIHYAMYVEHVESEMYQYDIHVRSYGYVPWKKHDKNIGFPTKNGSTSRFNL